MAVLEERPVRLEFFPITGVPEIPSGCALGAVLLQCLEQAAVDLGPQDIVAVAQKVVSKAEGRVVRLAEIEPSKRALGIAGETGKDARMVEVILRESRRIVRRRGDIVISETHHGFICANAGVDRSNVDGGEAVTLLPLDPDRSARRLAEELGCGIIITDTFGRAWREGLLDTTIGLAGVPPFVDFRGTTDRYGYPLQASILAAVDGLAAAAGLVMGKTEQIPAVVIRGFTWTRGDSSAQALLRPTHKDLFL